MANSETVILNLFARPAQVTRLLRLSRMGTTA